MAKVACVIPAYNEEERIGGVLNVVLRSALVDEVIVVSDGSRDRTYEVASGFEGVRAFQLEQNQGKGGAMFEGAKRTDADVLVFFDGDLHGLRTEHVDSLVKPVAGCKADMVIGVFRGGKWNTTLAQIISPNISGQRALRRELFLEIRNVNHVRYGVEVKINKHFRRCRYRVRRVILQGVSHTVREAKIGKWKGTVSRIKMYAEIIKVYFSKD